MFGPKSLLWIVWLGLNLIAIEVRHLHANILDQAGAWIPLAFCGITVASMPVCLWKTTKAKTLVLLSLFSAGALVGLIGVYYHTKLDPEPFVQLFTANRTPGAQPLAPLALSGLSMIGFLATRLVPPERTDTKMRRLIEKGRKT